MPLIDLAAEPTNSDLRPEGRRRFAMLFVGRTGSTFTVDVLNQHPDVRFEGEALRSFLSTENPAREQRQWLSNLWSAESMSAHRVVGFKTKSFDIPDLPGFRALVGEVRPTILLSERRDLLKQVVSAERINVRAARLRAEVGDEEWNRIGSTASAWNIAIDDEGIGAVAVDPASVVGSLEWIESAVALEKLIVEDLALTYGVDVVCYDYQDLLGDEQLFFSRLFRLLGVPEIEFRHRFSKHTPNDLSQAITNYDEVIAALRGTQFERFIGQS